MNRTYRHDCAACGFGVTTAGPARQPDGQLLARAYCSTCGEVRECVTSAPERWGRTPLGVPLGPAHGPAGRLARALARRLRPSAGEEAMQLVCPVCGGGDLLLAPGPGREPSCPRCERGRLVGRRL